MVTLSHRFQAWDILPIGLNVRRLWYCRLLLSDPSLCQSRPVHLTCTKSKDKHKDVKCTDEHKADIMEVA